MATKDVDSTKLRELSTAVGKLARDSKGPQHDGFITALDRLAGVMDAFSAPSEARQIREIAKQLASSNVSASNHADLVLQALQLGHRVLEDRRGADRQTVRASAASVRMLRAIDPKVPLLEQQSAVVDAFQAITNTAFAMQKLAAPFVLADVTRRDGRTTEVALADAHQHVLQLARADWSVAHTFAAKLMDDLARIIEIADPGARDSIAVLRVQAERLRSPGFDRAGAIKEGLTAAVEVLRDSSAVQTAKQAIASVQERSTLAFQRAPVQDAARATLQLFVASPRTETARR